MWMRSRSPGGGGLAGAVRAGERAWLRAVVAGVESASVGLICMRNATRPPPPPPAPRTDALNPGTRAKRRLLSSCGGPVANGWHRGRCGGDLAPARYNVGESIMRGRFLLRRREVRRGQDAAAVWAPRRYGVAGGPRAGLAIKINPAGLRRHPSRQKTPRLPNFLLFGLLNAPLPPFLSHLRAKMASHTATSSTLSLHNTAPPPTPPTPPLAFQLLLLWSCNTPPSASHLLVKITSHAALSPQYYSHRMHSRPHRPPPRTPSHPSVSIFIPSARWK